MLQWQAEVQYYALVPEDDTLAQEQLMHYYAIICIGLVMCSCIIYLPVEVEVVTDTC
jgi:hypothetical protein